MENLSSKLENVNKERIAEFCVCCGSRNLKNTPAILMPFLAERVFNWKQIKIDESWGLNTIKAGQTYSICNTLLCPECDFLFLDIRFSEKELSNLYSNYRGKKYTELRQKYEKDYKKRNKDLKKGITYMNKVESFIAKHVKLPLSILDWGGDTGQNSPFKNNNKILHVYDLGNSKPIKQASKIGKKDLNKNFYDLIVCSNVLEHVSYPSETLNDIKKNMTKQTILYIEIPYEKLILDIENKRKSFRDKKHWHEHVNFFSKKSILKLLKECSLKVIEFKKLKVSDGDFSLMQIVCKS